MVGEKANALFNFSDFTQRTESRLKDLELNQKMDYQDRQKDKQRILDLEIRSIKFLTVMENFERAMEIQASLTLGQAESVQNQEPSKSKDDTDRAMYR